MTAAEFWNIIDSTGGQIGVNREAQVERIEVILRDRNLDELASFNRHLYSQLSKAKTFHFMVATFAVFGCLNDGLFFEFRAWVMLLGSKVFKAAVKNPDTIANLLSRQEVDRVRCGNFADLPVNLWIERGADLELWANKVGFPDESPIATAWPKDRHDFEKRYPVLYKAFWDQSRVNANRPPSLVQEERRSRHAVRRRTKKQKAMANESSKGVAEMAPSRFWRIIDSTTREVGLDKGPQVVRIQNILREYQLDDVARFEKQLHRQLVKAYTFHFMVAAFLVYGYISDDLFLDFRAWVMLFGSRAFADATKNPDTIAKLLSRDEVDEIKFDGLPEVPLRVWLEKGGEMEVFFEKAGSVAESTIAMPWPESAREFEERYPVLFKGFWNPKRIQAFHGKR